MIFYFCQLRDRIASRNVSFGCVAPASPLSAEGNRIGGEGTVQKARRKRPQNCLKNVATINFNYFRLSGFIWRIISNNTYGCYQYKASKIIILRGDPDHVSLPSKVLTCLVLPLTGSSSYDRPRYSSFISLYCLPFLIEGVSHQPRRNLPSLLLK